MATVRKTTTLTTRHDAEIAKQIESGHDTNDGETTHELSRREQEHNRELEAVRAALIEGELSGEPEPFDFASFKQRKSAQHA